MPVVISGQTYCRMTDVCRMAGIGRSTLFARLNEGMISDVEYRDCRGWRLFTAAQLETIRTKTDHVTEISRGG